MRQQFTVGTRFALTTGGLMSLGVVLAGVSLWSVSSLESSVQQIITDPLRGTAQMGAAEAALLELRGNLLRHIAAADPAAKAVMENTFPSLESKFASTLSAYENTITTAEDRALYVKIAPAYQQYLNAIRAPIDQSREGKSSEAFNQYMAEAEPAFHVAQNLLNGEVDLNQRHGEQFAAASYTTYSQALWALALTAVFSLTVGVVGVFLVVRRLNGDLRTALTQLGETASRVAGAAVHAAASSQTLAQGSSQQAASLEETSASSEEINSMAARNSENSRTAADLVTHSSEKFAEANHKLDEMVVAMNEINAQSEKISRIIKVIDEIAFQTNILALNAAVEAARAGQAGMGFAVVAGEVRNLAQRSAQAARDTAALIEESIAKSNGGKAKVDQATAVIRTVAQEFEKMKTLVDEVNIGSQEQTRGIEQVAKAIVQMQSVTQQAAAGAQEGASAAQELTSQSRKMQEVLEILAGMVGGFEPATQPPEPSKAAAGFPGPAAPASRPGEQAFPLDQEF